MVRHHPNIKDVDEQQPKVVNIPVDQRTLHQCSKLPANSERVKKVNLSTTVKWKKVTQNSNLESRIELRIVLNRIEPKNQNRIVRFSESCTPTTRTTAV